VEVEADSSTDDRQASLLRDLSHAAEVSLFYTNSVLEFQLNFSCVVQILRVYFYYHVAHTC